MSNQLNLDKLIKIVILKEKTTNDLDYINNYLENNLNNLESKN